MKYTTTKPQNFKKIFFSTLLSCLVVLNSINAQTADLFISEYAEASVGYHKYIEIYNGTGVPVDLSFYEIWKVTNGGVWPEQKISLPLGFLLAPDDVFIVAHTSADPMILLAADLITGSANWNGDDAIGLFNLTSGMLIDVIGMDGPDPGSGWDVAGVSNATKDHTLVRKCSVNQGSIDWLLSAGLDSLSSEWLVLSDMDWSDIGQHTNPCASNPIPGCTDPTAYNFDPNANVDDGSCIISCLTPTNLQLQTTYDTRAWIEWDETSSIVDSVLLYKIRYRAVGDTSWMLKQKIYEGNQTPIVRTRLLFLTANTQYEMKIKAEYQSGCASDFGPLSYFTTLTECPNVDNFAVSTPLTTRATFSWDNTNGVYSFARIKFRVDSITNPTGADWKRAGGFGVPYGTNTRNKNGLIPGETYRGQSRTWCDPAGGPYRATGWTPLIWWTQPTVIRLGGEYAIANLEVYPNPSRGIFNVSFVSEEVQDLKVRIVNAIGDELLTEDLQKFVGEYVKSINLNRYTRGIYFLEIETNEGVTNKKLILQ